MKHCNPFTNRLCRDIRNDLSRALMSSLNQLDLTAVQKIADTYLATNPGSVHKQYILDRMEAYTRVLQRISSETITDPLSRSLFLWDEELFFEVHELLEHEWMNSKGATKLIFQAMIRAAGMYIQLDRNNTKGATSMAAKAVEAFESNRSKVPDILNLDRLLKKLRNVDHVPPQLTGKNS